MDTPNVNERSLGRALGKRALVYIGILVFIFALVLLINTSNASAAGPTVISGDVTSNTNWTADNSPYIVTTDINVANGVTLYVRPGTDVVFNAGASITVLGVMNANGNGSGVGHAVTFSSNVVIPGPGDWDGITYAAGSSGSVSNALVEYATDGITVNGAAATVTHVTIRNCDGDALAYNWVAGDHSLSLTDIIVDNTGNGIAVSSGGNGSLTLNSCFFLDVANVAVSVTAANASLTINGGALQSPVGLMTVAAVAQGTYSATVTATDTTIYDSAVCLLAASMGGNARVTATGSTLGNVAGINSYAVAAVSLTGKANIVLTDTTISNVTRAVYASSGTGDVSVTLNGATLTDIADYGVYATSTEGAVTISVSDSLFNHTTDSVAIFARANLTLALTMSGTVINDTAVGVDVESLNGAVNVIVSDSSMTSWEVGAFAESVNRGVTVTMTNVEILGSAGAYGIEVISNLTATLGLTNVTIFYYMNTIWANAANGGIVLNYVTGVLSMSGGDAIHLQGAGAMTATFDGVTFDEDGVLGGYALYAYSAVAGSGSLVLTNVSIVNTTGGVFFIVNGSAAVDITNLYFYGVNTTETDGVQVVAAGNIVANVNGAQFYGMYMDAMAFLAGGDLTLTATDVLLDNSAQESINSPDTSIVYAWADGNVDVGATGITGVQALSGLWIGSDFGDVNLVVTDMSMTTQTNASLFGWLFIFDGIYVDAEEGAANVSLTNVVINPFLNVGEDGLYLYANQTIELTIVDSQFINRDFGVDVTSNVGDVSASLSNVAIVNPSGVGASFYAQNGLIDLTMSSVQVIGGVNDAGVVAQCWFDLTVQFTDVFINHTAIGALLLSTNGNVYLTVVDSTIALCDEYGMEVVSANGLITASVDPSVYSGNWIGLYLDSALTLDLWVNDSLFEENYHGIEAHAAEAMNIWLYNDSFVDNTWMFNSGYGMFAESDNADLTVNIQACSSDNTDRVIELWTYTTDIYLNIMDSSFHTGYVAVLTEAFRDEVVNVVNTSFLGQGWGGLGLNSGRDTQVNVSGSTFDGKDAKYATLYQPTPIEDQYQILDPDVNWTTSDTMTVELPWAFEFNGVPYNEVNMSVNGWIAFGSAADTLIHDFGAIGTPNMIAATQMNWNANEYPGMGYKVLPDQTAIVFQWYVWADGQEQLKNVFEIWLFADGGIQIRYGPMEAQGLYTYDYGINVQGGLDWNLKLWRADVFSNDWMSVTFISELMSAGYGMWFDVEGNTTATVTTSTVSHYMFGGMIVQSVGWASVKVDHVDFSWIGPVPLYAALFVESYTMTIDVSLTDNSFAWVSGWAVWLEDSPLQGGVSTMTLDASNSFSQVMFTAALVTSIENDTMQGALELTTHKTVNNITAANVGPVAMVTIVATPLASWTLVSYDMAVHDALSGNVDPWLVAHYHYGTPMWPTEPAMIMSTQVLMTSVGESSAQHFVSILDNTLTDAGWWDSLSEEPMLAGVAVMDQYGLTGSAMMDCTQVFDVVNNVIVSNIVPFMDGVMVGTLQQYSAMYPANVSWVAGLSLSTTLNFMLNQIHQDEMVGIGDGLGFADVQSMTGAKGDAALTVDVMVTDNNISGFHDAVDVAGSSALFNQWGTTTMDVTLMAERNVLSAPDDGVAAAFWTNATFSHYFPPYEQVVGAAASMTFAIDVNHNEMDIGGAGVQVYTDGMSQANNYGVFTTASVALSGHVTANDNNITAIDADNGIYARSTLVANVGGAVATSDITYTMLRNDIVSDLEANGIYLETYATAETLSLRYTDEPTTKAKTTFNVKNNTIEGADYAIGIVQEADANLGESVANLTSTVTATGNILTDVYSEGVYVDISGRTNSNEGVPAVNVNATVLIAQNMVQGYSWSYESYMIDAEVYAGDYYTGADAYGVDLMESSILIDTNDISNGWEGIYAYTWWTGSVPVTIINNTIDSCGYGMEVDDSWFMITGNVITNVVYEGIEIYYGTGTIQDNFVSGMAGYEADGIVLYDDYFTMYDEVLVPYWVYIQNNTLTDLGGDGIYTQDFYMLSITENRISYTGGDGIMTDGSVNELDYLMSYGLEVQGNTLTAIGGNAIGVNGATSVDIYLNVVDGASGYGIAVAGILGYDYGAMADDVEGMVDSSYIDIWMNVLGNVESGIGLYYCEEVMVHNNQMSSGTIEETPEPTIMGMPSGVGLYIFECYDVSVYSVTITGFDTGVWIEDSSYIGLNAVQQSMAAMDGGVVIGVDGLVIEESAFISNHRDGLTLNYSFEVTLQDLTISQNGMDGLVINSGSDITVWNGVYVNNGLGGLVAYAPIDWKVDGTSVVNNNWVVLFGDLTVLQGGELKLNLVDFAVLGDYRDSLAVISVENGGSLNASSVEFYFDAWIGPYDPGFYYEFNVLGSLEFRSVTLEDALELYLGPTSQANIESSTIMSNLRNGIHVEGSAPVILNSIIVDNPRAGIYLDGSEAAPEVTDCILAANERGIYAVGANLGRVTDNVFALNTVAGIYCEDVNGAIHDNTFLLNSKEIYAVRSTLSIQDNEIGYSKLVDVIAQFAPLLGLLEYGGSTSIELGAATVDFDTSMLMNLLLGHTGIYAVDSTITTSGNDFGMLTTGINLQGSSLSFNDDIVSRFITIPYMDKVGQIRNMSLPVPVYDGIIARDSSVVVNGGTISVMDDAIFLDSSTGTIANANLVAGDFGIYLMRGATATLTNVVFDKVKVESGSTLTVASALTVIVKDPWGNTLANVPVAIKNATGVLKAQGRTDANGAFTANVVSYVQTASGVNSAMGPYRVNASFGGVDTSGYPGDKAEFSPAEVAKSVSVPAPTTVVIQTNVIVWYDLTVKAAYPSGDPVSGAAVTLVSADGKTYTGTTGAGGMNTTLVISYVQTPTGQDTSMQPYTLTVLFPEHGSMEGASRVDFSPRAVSMTVTVDQTKSEVVKTGIMVYHVLTLVAKDAKNNSVPGVYMVVKDANGMLAADGPTGEDGSVAFDVVAYTQAANGTVDKTMNPYTVTSSWDGATGVPAMTDMSSGNVQLTILKFVPDNTLSLAVAFTAISATLIGIALYLVSRRL